MGWLQEGAGPQTPPPHSHSASIQLEQWRGWFLGTGCHKSVHTRKREKQVNLSMALHNYPHLMQNISKQIVIILIIIIYISSILRTAQTCVSSGHGTGSGLSCVTVGWLLPLKLSFCVPMNTTLLSGVR